MPSIPLADAVILFQPIDAPTDGTIKPGTLRVVQQEAYALRQRFTMDWPVPFLCRSAHPHVRLTALMLLFRHLTVDLGVPAADVDATFMDIEEYSAAIGGY